MYDARASKVRAEGVEIGREATERSAFDLQPVQQRQRVSPEVFYPVRTGWDRRITMPTLVVAQKSETFSENRRLVVPHLERGAQRVGQDENGRVLRPFEDVVQFHYGFFGHF